MIFTNKSRHLLFFLSAACGVMAGFLVSFAACLREPVQFA